MFNTITLEKSFFKTHLFIYEKDSSTNNIILIH